MRPLGRAAFTLMELIGVMAILSILASVLVPSIILRIDRANSTKETRTLESLAEALVAKIRSRRAIPDGAQWSQLIAEELGVPLDRVTRSVGQQRRVYLVDPGMAIGEQGGALPYHQTAGGASAIPRNTRVLLISSRLLPLPAFLQSGVAASSEQFAHLWDAPRGTVPKAWPADWGAHGEDLHIERIDLARLFHRVVINDITDGTPAQFSVDGSAAITVPRGGVDAYYLEGSELTLLADGLVASREVIDQDLSYTFERGIWRGQLWEGRSKDATDLAAALDRFRQSRITAAASSLSNQRLVVDAFHNYSLLYSSWSRAGFPTYAADNQIAPLYEALLEARGQLALLSGNLVLKN